MLWIQLKERYRSWFTATLRLLTTFWYRYLAFGRAASNGMKRKRASRRSDRRRDEDLLHRETEDGRLVSPGRMDPASHGMLVMVSDADAYCTRLREAGARIEYGPVDQPYGQREFEALDSEGRRWWFASRI